MSKPMFTCRGGPARTEIERALCLQALEEIEAGKNLGLWCAKIIMIFAEKQSLNPERRYGGHFDGEWKSIPEMVVEYGEIGVLKAWNIYKNERKGCGQALDDTIRELEDQYPVGTEMYRDCPKCGDKDLIVIGRTNWENK